jgi:hypothetical protein
MSIAAIAVKKKTVTYLEGQQVEIMEERGD